MAPPMAPTPCALAGRADPIQTSTATDKELSPLALMATPWHVRKRDESSDAPVGAGAVYRRRSRQRRYKDKEAAAFRGTGSGEVDYSITRRRGGAGASLSSSSGNGGSN